MDTNRHKSRLVAVLFILLALLSAGCAQKPRPPSEAELQAKAVLNATFTGSTAEFWYAVQRIGPTTRLVELHRPDPELLAQTVSETDRMNGVTERYNLTLTAAQYRYWNGQWTDWQQGVQGGGALVNALVGGITGFWMVVLEKRDGAWQVHEFRGNLLHDRTTLQRMLAASGGT